VTPANRLRASYDQVAADYTAQIADELAAKPLDRALLAAFAEQAGALGLVADLGCGPGHVVAHLAATGIEVEGIDLSDGMVAAARQRYPALVFRQGDMRSLAAADATYGGVVAFYSIIHLADDELAPTFREWQRALRPSGLALVAFHIGDAVLHLDTWWQRPVDLDFRFLPVERVTTALVEAQFTIEAVTQRAPYPGAEHASQRAYVLARKGAS
jgi:SAM-dependent methyltransferase